MSDHVSDTNIEAYHIMAEILVTVRRIVQRGLEKAAGKTWYVDGCPPSVYERLVARKENEVAIDRFDREYQELISFASLDDLAEIIEFNEDLARLLEGIAPETETIIERFRHLETLRLKLDATVPLDQDDVDALLQYHKEFRESLAQPQKRKAAEEAETEPAATAAEEPQVAEVSGGDEAETSEVFGTRAAEPEELGAEDVVADELDEGAEDVVLEELDQGDMVTDEPSDAFETAVVDSDVIEAPPVTAADDETELAAVEQAMENDDDGEVLRALHREIMSVAEHVLKGDVDQEFPVWNTLKERGWYDIKQTALGISLVENFYSIAEQVRAKTREAASPDDLKAFLKESEASKLLLSLGDMFKRLKL
jgi:hypothetical protein